jgi:hypothetical protein
MDAGSAGLVPLVLTWSEPDPHADHFILERNDWWFGR